MLPKKIETWTDFRAAWKYSPLPEQRVGLLQAWPQAGAEIEDPLPGVRFGFYVSVAASYADKAAALTEESEPLHSAEGQVCIRAVMRSYELIGSVENANALFAVMQRPVLRHLLGSVDPYSRKTKDALNTFRSKAPRLNKQVGRNGTQSYAKLPTSWYDTAIATKNADLVRVGCDDHIAYMRLVRWISNFEPERLLDDRLRLIAGENKEAYEAFMALRLKTGNFGSL